MKFMSIYRWDPENRDEMNKRGLELIESGFEGFKVEGMWTAIGANTIFAIYETDDPMMLLRSTRPFTDLGTYEIMPIMDTLTEVAPFVKEQLKT